MPAPDDESVTQCTERWQALAAGLLGGAERSGDSSSSSSGTADPSDPPLVHVIVCEPEGVRGAAVVLGGGGGGGGGDGGGGGGGAGAGTILLRRSSLWQSLSSLVHQVRRLEKGHRQGCWVHGLVLAQTRVACMRVRMPCMHTVCVACCCKQGKPAHAWLPPAARLPSHRKPSGPALPSHPPPRSGTS